MSNYGQKLISIFGKLTFLVDLTKHSEDKKQKTHFLKKKKKMFNIAY